MRILAIDIGGSKLLVGLVLLDMGHPCSYHIQSKFLQPLHEKISANRIIELIASIVPKSWVYDQIGVTIPGLVDSERGLWLYSPFSGIRNFPIVSCLQHTFAGMPISVENDVNACAMAELKFGACRGENDFLWVTVSNGIGGGLICNGKIYGGANGHAGEIGHVKVESKMPYKCGCGKYGCLEAEAAGPAISKRYSDHKKSKELFSAKEIADFARRGDADALFVYRETGKYLGKAFAMAANLLNPNKIIVGGGVSSAYSLFEGEMKSAFFEEAFSPSIGTQIEATGLGYEAGLLGAAAVAAF